MILKKKFIRDGRVCQIVNKNNKKNLVELKFFLIQQIVYTLISQRSMVWAQKVTLMLLGIWRKNLIKRESAHCSNALWILERWKMATMKTMPTVGWQWEMVWDWTQTLLTGQARTAKDVRKSGAEAVYLITENMVQCILWPYKYNNPVIWILGGGHSLKNTELVPSENETVFLGALNCNETFLSCIWN